MQRGHSGRQYKVGSEKKKLRVVRRRENGVRNRSGGGL
jgi:hypothetical protein